ncbi:MAG: rhodanese-like domain-containing protein, partial [Haloarculaceae archaeon]
MVETITASRLRDRIDAGESFTLLDTRPEESYEAWHIRDATQYTYDPDSEFDAGEFRSRTGLT